MIPTQFILLRKIWLWVSILAGTCILTITAWMILAVTKSVLRQIEEEDLGNL